MPYAHMRLVRILCICFVVTGIKLVKAHSGLQIKGRLVVDFALR